MSPGCCRRSTDFRSGAGNTAGNVCRSDISKPSEFVCRLWQDSHPFPVHMLEHWFLASLCVCVYVCYSLSAFPSLGRASCPRNVPSLLKIFSGCPPRTIQVIFDASSFLLTHTDTHTHRWHYSAHMHTEQNFCISLTSSHKVWTERTILQSV